MDTRRRLESTLKDLLSAHRSGIKAMLRRRLSSRPDLDVDDIWQDFTVRLWKSLDHSVGEKKIDHPASYLYTIANSALIDAVRRATTRDRVDGPDDAADQVDPESSPEMAERDDRRRERLLAALDTLAPDRSRAVRLYLQGFNADEIARLAGWSPARARNLTYRGLDDLKAVMAAERDNT